MCTGGPFPGAKRSWGVTLTTHPHLVTRSRMSRSYTSSPSKATIACSGTALLCSLWSTAWILKCYLDEFGLQRIKQQWSAKVLGWITLFERCIFSLKRVFNYDIQILYMFFLYFLVKPFTIKRIDEHGVNSPL